MATPPILSEPVCPRVHLALLHCDALLPRAGCAVWAPPHPADIGQLYTELTTAAGSSGLRRWLDEREAALVGIRHPPRPVPADEQPQQPPASLLDAFGLRIRDIAVAFEAIWETVADTAAWACVLLQQGCQLLRAGRRSVVFLLARERAAKFYHLVRVARTGEHGVEGPYAPPAAWAASLAAADPRIVAAVRVAAEAYVAAAAMAPPHVDLVVGLAALGDVLHGRGVMTPELVEPLCGVLSVAEPTGFEVRARGRSRRRCARARARARARVCVCVQPLGVQPILHATSSPLTPEPGGFAPSPPPVLLLLEPRGFAPYDERMHEPRGFEPSDDRVHEPRGFVRRPRASRGDAEVMQPVRVDATRPAARAVDAPPQAASPPPRTSAVKRPRGRPRSDVWKHATATGCAYCATFRHYGQLVRLKAHLAVCAAAAAAAAARATVA